MGWIPKGFIPTPVAGQAPKLNGVIPPTLAEGPLLWTGGTAAGGLFAKIILLADDGSALENSGPIARQGFNDRWVHHVNKLRQGPLFRELLTQLSGFVLRFSIQILRF